MAEWTFITSHGRVLLVLASEPGLRVRDIAERVRLTERAVMQVLHDLREAGYVSARRDGRRAYYSVDPTLPMRSDPLKGKTVGEFLTLLADVGQLHDG